VRDQISGVHVEIGGLRKEMDDGFATINRRLNQIIQTQLDEHATRIKQLEAAVFSKYSSRLAYKHRNDRHHRLRRTTTTTS
jgi:hypothetical protein